MLDSSVRQSFLTEVCIATILHLSGTSNIYQSGSISSLVHALINQRGFTFSDSIPTKHISGLLNTSITIVNITLGSSKNVIAGEIVEFNNAEHLTANVPAKDADESVEEEIVDNF